MRREQEAADQKNRQKMFEATHMSSSAGDSAKLPCFYVPFRQNLNFFGQKSLLQSIESNLRSEPSQNTVPSTAIWGYAGVGKTQIALEYANRQREKGVKAVLWVSSEGDSEFAKAFTEIAEHLELKGATSSKGHDQNRLLVLRWLQQTSKFDEFESPISILIKCRGSLVSDF